ncbi:helix-turn-helix domain-containing protein [Pseudalkalibacillus caeni]|uniref:Helix-turn-helix domain-containing protein n=1 Tax=Exobacillus caeni TaxID=2574798 RepID=A0A5R9F2B7_9BACL|nr:helix-turn-helix domain-containing protein [Pseudalkalibacillus caeni]TLS36466.1 helix-turn-helix domain-containing protein [Pseudalkalibacillus caeni]
MPHIMDSEQEKMWDSIKTLIDINGDQAKAVFKAAIERSFHQVGLTAPKIANLPFTIPKPDDLDRLRAIEKQMREAYNHNNYSMYYKLFVDYVEQLSKTSEQEPLIRRELFTSFLHQQTKRKRRPHYRVNRFTSAGVLVEEEKETTNYYSPGDVAKKLGLSDQTIRRMCSNDKFPGAYQTPGGHWRIPRDTFITTDKQDEEAETILNKIDAKNEEAGEIDEFDL